MTPGHSSGPSSWATIGGWLVGAEGGGWDLCLWVTACCVGGSQTPQLSPLGARVSRLMVPQEPLLSVQQVQSWGSPGLTGHAAPASPDCPHWAMPPEVHGASLARQLPSTESVGGWGCGASSPFPPPPQHCLGPASVSFPGIALWCPYWSPCFQPHLSPQLPSQSAVSPQTSL